MKKLDRRRAIIEAGATSAALCFPWQAAMAGGWEKFNDLYEAPPWYPEKNRSLEEPPERIVENGRIRLGLFNRPCREMNLMDARVFKGGERRWLASGTARKGH